MSMNSKSIADAIKERRSIRNLKKPENMTKEKIEEILKVALYTPSAFCMQSARMIVVTGDENKKLWDIAKDEVKKTLPAGQDFKPTEDKLNGFAAGFGTILFFEEDTTVKNMQDNFSLYADNFPVWAEQASVKKEWNVPSTWRLRAQMPFGLADETPGDRKFLDFGEVVKLY